MYCLEIYVIIRKGLNCHYAGSQVLFVFRVFLLMSYKFLKLFFFFSAFYSLQPPKMFSHFIYLFIFMKRSHKITQFLKPLKQ